MHTLVNLVALSVWVKVYPKTKLNVLTQLLVGKVTTRDCAELCEGHPDEEKRCAEFVSSRFSDVAKCSREKERREVELQYRLHSRCCVAEGRDERGGGGRGDQLQNKKANRKAAPQPILS